MYNQPIIQNSNDNILSVIKMFGESACIYFIFIYVIICDIKAYNFFLSAFSFYGVYL